MWDRRFLGLAKHVAEWSKDPSTQVGAVIIDAKNRIVSLGFNGLPRGLEDTSERLANRDIKYQMTVHAEHNAVLFAERNLEGCSLFTWPLPPCSRCASFIIQVGIARVVSPLAAGNPRWGEDCALAAEMFREAGVRVEELSLE